MAKNPTIADVAERAGVSKATVSAVINDKNTVSEATRRRVYQIINELNYRPRAAARQRFQGDDEPSIGFVIKEDDNPYYAEITAGVRHVAARKGYTLLVASSEGSYEAEHQIIDTMAAKDIRGLIITPVLDDKTDLSHIFELKRRNIPFVLLEKVRGVQAHLVDVDNVKASRDIVTYLIAQGHSHIVHFAGPSYSAHSGERIEGIRRAFSESLLAFQDDYIVYAGAHLQDGYEQGLAYFRKHKQNWPTAITCYNDLVAIGLLKALHELNIRVPEEVSVFGFDNIALLDYLPLPLSSAHVPKVEMGEKAAEILIQHLESKHSSPLQKVTLEAELVIRHSTTGPRLDGVAQQARRA